MHGINKRVIMRGWTLGIGWCLVVGDGDCVAIFHSIHRVMKAEKVLKEKCLDILLTPVPRSLSADCGMVIRYSYLMQDAVLHALAESNLEVAEVWLKQNGEYQRIV